MTATIIKGKPIAEEIREQVRREAAELDQHGKPLKLVAIQVGENPASEIYTRMQKRNCEGCGIHHEMSTLPADISEDDLINEVQKLNVDRAVTGMVLQLPVPPHIDARRVVATMDPFKDVEAVHPENMGRLIYGRHHVAPCTPMAVMELLGRNVPEMAGKEVVIVGHSDIVGKPLASMLLASRDQAPTVSICHVATRDLRVHTQRADVLIVAAGVAQARWLAHSRRQADGPSTTPDLSPLISGDMIQPGATVIDVAINRIPVGFDEDGQPLRDDEGKVQMTTTGDVDFDSAVEVAGAITPVPGGVGPLTVAMLLKNIAACAPTEE
jgi:methylenetetrahydrofolate dehydrogenase (NADP+)/methenyltetrahydrofolate cyclohydrolase